MSHFKFIVVADKSLDCGICHSTMLRPVTLSCGHSSCQECLEKLVAATVKPSCPLCRTAFANDATLNVNIALNTLTSNLEVACTNDECGWTGTYERAEDHSNQCPKKKVRCLNQDCQHVLTNEEMAWHLLICDKQLISCTDCGMTTARDMLAHHLSELCLYKKIYCPLGCGEVLPRCHVTLHLEKCDEKAVQCSVSGCHAVFRRKDNEDHVYTVALSHMVLQAGEVQWLRRILYHNNYDKAPTITLKEGKTSSFKWKVEQFSLYADAVIASLCFVCPERYRWRGIWENSILYLQLQTAANPVTAKIRVVPLKDNKEAVTVPTIDLKEGEMVKAGGEALKNACLSED